MARENTESAAIALGFTDRYLLEGEFASVEALVKPGTDFDETFEAFDYANSEWLIISGWLLDSAEKL